MLIGIAPPHVKDITTKIEANSATNHEDDNLRKHFAEASLGRSWADLVEAQRDLPDALSGSGRPGLFANRGRLRAESAVAIDRIAVAGATRCIFADSAAVEGCSPMRRVLKGLAVLERRAAVDGRRMFPDEEGTERSLGIDPRGLLLLESKDVPR